MTSPLLPLGGVSLSRAARKDEKNDFSYEKNDDCNNHRLCVLCLWLRSGIERYAGIESRRRHFQFFVSGFVGLLTYPFMYRGFSPLHKRIVSAFSRSHDSPSNDRFSPHAGIPRMENNTLESQLLSESCRTLAISNVQTAILRWIPSVSGIYTRFPCSANKHACPISRVAHLPQKPCYLVYYLRTCFSARKKTSPALLSRRQKKSRVLYIFSFGVRKKYQAIRLVGWLVGWLVGCKNRSNYLHFYNYLPCSRTSPFQNLHPYHTANRSHCKACK